MSYTRLIYHIVWRTHNSAPTIPEDKKRIMLTYIMKMCENKRWHLIRINAHLDHLHVLLEARASDAVADIVKYIKGSVSHAFKGHPDFPLFDGWNEGYGAFTVGFREIPIVKEYIKNQEMHHASVATADEFEMMLREQGMEKGDYEDW